MAAVTARIIAAVAVVIGSAVIIAAVALLV
jgi:hypothetical protein